MGRINLIIIALLFAVSAQAATVVSDNTFKTYTGANNARVSAKQATLASGTNIKTVGGVSLLGSGDVGVLGASYGGAGTVSGPLKANGSGTVSAAAYGDIVGLWTTCAGFMKSDGTCSSGTGSFSGGTLTSPLTLAPGDIGAGLGPLYMQAGALLTTPAAGAWEFYGGQLYFTPAAARKSVAFLDSNITGSSASTTGNAATVTGFSPTAGKTLSVTQSLTLSGTDSTVMTFPTTSKTIMASDYSNAGTAPTWNQNTTGTAVNLSGNMDITSSSLGILMQFGSGQKVAAGDVCYLKSDGKMWKAKADSAATAGGKLGIAMSNYSGAVTGSYKIYGIYSSATGGKTTGSTYFLSAATGGATTATAPSSTGNIMRVIGWAKSATKLIFDPSKDYGTIQ